MSDVEELIRSPASGIVARLRAGTLSPHDLLDALEQRVAAVNPAINALPTLCFERARAEASRLLDLPLAERGILAGLPIPIKDLTAVAGVRTTQGSPIFADTIPDESDILVETLERSGGIVYAKSNTPEFGAGAQTFNEVFGTTRNPWNLSRSVAGSSGGAAAALASGMAWLAHGSDMGGSLRNPASFCGVVGLRPSPGRVATTPGSVIDDTLSVEGPMARNVADVALMLDAMTGAHGRDPRSRTHVGASFAAAAAAKQAPKRVAFSATLGITPVDPEVAGICRRAAHDFVDAGVIVEEAHPDLSEAHECFQTLRALNFAIGLGGLYDSHRSLLKPEVIWNVEQGLKLTSRDIARAQAQRAVLYQRMATFFETYDLLLCPATITAAFPAEQRYLAECDGHRFETYIDWLAIVYAITLVSSPAISIPAGFTAEGLPVGLQIVARPQAEAELLSAAAVLEQVLNLGPITPIDPRAGA
ncbi:amidase [Rhodoligotrophos appendicifer]|uniref:amidase n=1 Tax=Rhodoligotrophos appendicifer TaxID=987056 RepID=UPI00117F02AD|nr:amidase family protein [Rhodoligotrophos appendicifer]